MKRYLLFSFAEYYPSGGLGDTSRSFDTVDEARIYVNDPINYLSENWYVWDRIEDVIVIDNDKPETYALPVQS